MKLGITHAFALAALTCLVAACFPKSTPQAPTLSAAQISAATTRGAAPESLERGHAVFVAKCNGCHGYPDIAEIPESKWPSVIEKMSKKADLNAEQSADTLNFVQAAAAH